MSHWVEGETRPRCDCHDEPMVGRGHWQCAEKGRERSREWREANREKERERVRKWREANPEERRESDCRANRRRCGWYDEGGMATQEEMERISEWKL